MEMEIMEIYREHGDYVSSRRSKGYTYSSSVFSVLLRVLRGETLKVRSENGETPVYPRIDTD
jgi:hypothetical protein